MEPSVVVVKVLFTDEFHFASRALELAFAAVGQHFLLVFNLRGRLEDRRRAGIIHILNDIHELIIVAARAALAGCVE